MAFVLIRALRFTKHGIKRCPITILEEMSSEISPPRKSLSLDDKVDLQFILDFTRGQASRMNDLIAVVFRYGAIIFRD